MFNYILKMLVRNGGTYLGASGVARISLGICFRQILGWSISEIIG